MLDTPNPSLDRALAQHLCQLYATDRNENNTNFIPYDRKTMAHYISYARELDYLYTYSFMTKRYAVFLLDFASLCYVVNPHLI
jgi:DNA replicative helicase MCM subunit Mcm2 (Cdc46/Mcm family)